MQCNNNLVESSQSNDREKQISNGISDAFNIHLRKFKSNPLLSLPFYCHLVQNAKGEVT